MANATKQFTFLDQRGPKTLNSILKKNQIKSIEVENAKIHKQIKNAKSAYSRTALNSYNARIDNFKELRMAASPSLQRLDPLVAKREKKARKAVSKSLSLNQ